MSTTRTRVSRRSGFTLAELLVALGLLAVVGGAMLRAMDRQARFHAGVVQLLEARQQLTASHEVIAAELRSLSALHDVELVTDTSFAYRTPVGSGVVCRITATDIDLAPEQVASGAILARARTAPQPGDTVWLQDEGPGVGSADDRWHAASLASAVRRRDACLGTAYVDSLRDAGLDSWRLTLTSAAPLPPGVSAGSTVRLTRRSRFVLYRSATGDWSLGWADWNHALHSWNTLQPVAGSLLALNRTAPASSGVAFAARDSLGTSVPPPALAPSAHGIAVVARARTARAVRVEGMRFGRRVDSLRSFTALRNVP